MSLVSLYDAASLWMTPSGAEDGKLFSELPTDGSGDFTFSRGSNLAATRVGPTGLIEKGRENLFVQSNQFDTTWTKSNATLTSGQSGYDGSSDAWLLEATDTTTNLYQIVSSSGVCTISLYAKAGTTNNLVFYVLTSPSTRAGFDLTTGSVNYELRNVDASIEDVGNGWYRCSMTFEGASTSVRIYPTDNTFTATIGDNIYIQDAQLEIGLAATEVITTGATTGKAGLLEDEPRFDYSGGATCPSLLLEPSRTNNARYSEYFEGWPTTSNCSFTSNYAISPEGLNNASRLVFSGNGYSYGIGFGQGGAIGTIYSLSCYAKRNDNNTQDIGFFVNGSGDVNSSWALTTEWKRFEFSYATTNNSLVGIAGENGADVSVYGFQIEQAASYPTSYIPTYGSSVTRAGDNTGTIDVSSLGVTTGYTLFYELGDFNVAFGGVWLAQSGGSDRAYQVYGATAVIKTNSGDVYPFNHGASGEGTGIKVAVNYDGTNINVFKDGTKRGTWVANKTIWDALTNLDMTLSNLQMVNWKQLLVFPTALTDSECIKLTTL